MFGALQGKDMLHAASLWHMALTVTVQLRHGLSDAQKAAWSISCAELARSNDLVVSDTFPAFATKCLLILGEDSLSQQKACQKLTEHMAVYKGAKMSKNMAGAILVFKTAVSSSSRQILNEIEAGYGKDVLTDGYTKLARLVQICTEASKFLNADVADLVESALDALSFALKHDLVKPHQISMEYLDTPRETRGTRGTAVATPTVQGFVVRAIARASFVQHLGLEHDSISKGEAKDTAANLAADISKVCHAMRHYRAFDATFMAPESVTVESHLEIYKKTNMQTAVGRSLVDFFYDVMCGEHDAAIADHAKSVKEGWKKGIEWRKVDVEGWLDIIGAIDMASMSVPVEPCTAPSGPRVLQRSTSAVSEDGREEESLKEAERARVWAQAVAARKKFVQFVSPRAWSEKGIQEVYEESSLFSWEGKATERHKVFLFSADLHHEELGAAWASLPGWKEQMAASVRFMLTKQGHSDLLAFADGRARQSRRELEKLVDSARNFSEVTVVFQSSPRLGRRVAWSSDNREMIFLSLPVPRTMMPVKPRATSDDPGTAAGESTTHDSTYTGVAPLPWGAMPVLSTENKEKILGTKPSKPRVQLYDCAVGIPLFWAERKSASFWRTFFADIGAGCIVDTTPGAGTAACAAMMMELPYIGIARNSCHANFLANIADRGALHMMRTKGCPLHHQELEGLIIDHFASVLKSVEHMESAEDTAPEADVPLDVAPA